MASNDMDTEIREILKRAKPAGFDSTQVFKIKNILVSLSIVVAEIAACVGAYSYFSVPRGEIMSLRTIGEASRDNEMSGFTRNFPVECNYIWGVSNKKHNQV